MLDRLRVRARRWVRGRLEAAVRGHAGLERGLDRAVVGHVVGDAAVLDGSGAPTEGDVHQLRLGPLDPGQLLDVGADLEQRRRLDVARQLGVDDLVAPLAEGAGAINAQEEVGQPEPPPVEERGLVDHVVAPPDRLLRRGSRRTQPLETLRARQVVPAGIDAGDAPALCFERCQIAGLVLEAALGDQVDLRIEPDRPVDQTGHRRELQADQVLARQIADQIGRGEDGAVVDELHRRPR